MLFLSNFTHNFTKNIFFTQINATEKSFFPVALVLFTEYRALTP